jgi:hypothetical protein
MSNRGGGIEDGSLPVGACMRWVGGIFLGRASRGDAGARRKRREKTADGADERGQKLLFIFVRESSRTLRLKFFVREVSG